MRNASASAGITGTPRLGVGIIGAGPVTQAIHLPTLARLADQFDVIAIMDVDAAVAGSVADRVGAEHTTDVVDIYNDDRIDVIVVCSPAAFHADQVIAACRAGVKAILCEKPFAVTAEEATAIAAVSAETGVPIVVGAMHAFDPGWLSAAEHWGDLVSTAHIIRSTIVLPPNPRFEDFATEVAVRPVVSPSPPATREQLAEAVAGGVLSLAIHDLPLIRQFLPGFDDLVIERAEWVSPFGYAITGMVAGRTIDLRAAMTTTWKPDWRLEVFGRSSSLTVAFTPSYVQGGSAVAELHTHGEVRTFGPYSGNGYQGEWEHLARLARGDEEPTSTERLIDDLRFALAIADAVTTSPRSRQESAA